MPRNSWCQSYQKKPKRRPSKRSKRFSRILDNRETNWIRAFRSHHLSHWQLIWMRIRWAIKPQLAEHSQDREAQKRWRRDSQRPFESSRRRLLQEGPSRSQNWSHCQRHHKRQSNNPALRKEAFSMTSWMSWVSRCAQSLWRPSSDSLSLISN